MPDQKPTLEYGRPSKHRRADWFAIFILKCMGVGLVLAFLMILMGWAHDHGYLQLFGF